MRYLREDRPGLGHAHNCGLRAALGTLVAFTDDDVIVDPDWLSAIAEDFISDPEIGCVTGLILPAELETGAQYLLERHGSFGKGFPRLVFDLEENRPTGRLFRFDSGRFGSGANMAFRKEVLLKLGGFDPALGAGTLARGGDDIAAFFCVIDAGYRIAYEPRALVWHHHRRDEAGLRRQAFGYGVGLGAYLTKILLDRPARIFDFAAAVPAGLLHLLAPTPGKTDGFPLSIRLHSSGVSASASS